TPTSGIYTLSLHDALPISDRSKPEWSRIGEEMRDLVMLWSRRYWHDLDLPFRSALADERLVRSQTDQQSWLVEWRDAVRVSGRRSEEHTSELQSQSNLVCR